MIKWDPLCTCEREEGEIHVTPERKRKQRNTWRGKEGWVVKLFIRFAFFKRNAN